MVEKKKTTKGKKTVQSKKTKSTVKPIIVNLNSDDLYGEFLIARDLAGGKLNFDERIYLWNRMLKACGITLVRGEEKEVKSNWLKQLTRWIKSLTRKF